MAVSVDGGGDGQTAIDMKLAELRSACMGDAMKLCSASLFNMDSLHSCLQAKKSQASPKCQAQYDAESKTATKR
jgi:hypothetical protein